MADLPLGKRELTKEMDGHGSQRFFAIHQTPTWNLDWSWDCGPIASGAGSNGESPQERHGRGVSAPQVWTKVFMPTGGWRNAHS